MTSVVIWGAGAVGGTIGAYLVRAGHEVLFVDIEADHLHAIRARRLEIEGPIDAFMTGGPAVTPTEMTGRHPLILLAVKAHHTETAARSLAPFLADDGVVVSCQNGLNEIQIADIVGRNRTIGAFVNFLADYREPGRILYGGRGAVVIGELDGRRTQRIAQLHDLLRTFEPEAILTDNIFGYLWGKSAWGTILKASALADAGITEFIENPAYESLIVALVREVLAIAEKCRVRPLGFDGFDLAAFASLDRKGMEESLRRVVEHHRRSAKTHSGVWRDLVVRKRRSDAAAQLAPVRAQARVLGLATPLLDKLVALIGSVESGERNVGSKLIAELQAAAEEAK